jgi:UDP-glucose 4-epimerase
VTSTARHELDREVDVLRDFMEAVVDRATSSSSPGRAAVFLASSAGGVYSGSSDPPFTEHTEPRPLAPYGEAKLAAEGVVRDVCGAAGVSALIGRIGNLYGPGQNVRKPQGLITHLCRSHVTGQPTSIYVSLDTLRDYIYVQDCAEMVVDGFERLERHRADEPEASSVVTKIMASQRSVSVGALLMESRRVFRRPLRILVASSPYSNAQVRDLRLRSVVWPELDRRNLTPLPAGISATVADLEQRMGTAHR